MPLVVIRIALSQQGQPAPCTCSDLLRGAGRRRIRPDLGKDPPINSLLGTPGVPRLTLEYLLRTHT